MIPVTHYPVATQRQLERNRRRIAGKPYAHYFDPELRLDHAVLPAIQHEMDPADALDVADIDRLLDEGHHAVETGYCLRRDGSGYVCSRVEFRDCAIEALRWWWWWHSAEPTRYMLWFPHSHVSVTRDDPETLTKPGLSDEERYVGSVHHVDEFVGPSLSKIDIAFVDPSEFGLDVARIHAGNIVHACGWVSLRSPPIRIVRMVHLARSTDWGFELRSRYWIAQRPVLRTPLGSIRADLLLRLAGVTRQDGLRTTAYDLLLHDQIEFTHLASFLSRLHAEFG